MRLIVSEEEIHSYLVLSWQHISKAPQAPVLRDTVIDPPGNNKTAEGS